MRKASKPKDISPDKLVGLRIRDERNRLGWSQQQLADALGCSYNKISMIETRKSGVSLSDLIKIARLLKIPPFFLLQDVIDPGQIDAMREVLATRRDQLEAELVLLDKKLSDLDIQVDAT